MQKKDFLETLRRRLAPLEKAERDKIVRFYTEMLEDRLEEGMTEEEAVAGMEPVDDIANRILAEQQKPPRAPKQTGRNIWLLALSSPFWLPFLVVYASLWLVIVMLLGAFLLLPPVLTVSFAGEAVVGLATVPFLALYETPVQALMNLGASLLCAGLAVFSFWLSKGLGRAAVRAAGVLFRAAMRPVYWLFGVHVEKKPAKPPKKPAARGNSPALRISMAVAGGCVALGLVVGLTGFGSVGFQTERLSTRITFQPREVNASLQDVTTVELDTSFTRVQVVPTSGSEARVKVMENEKERYEIGEVAGNLRIKRVSDRKWYEYVMNFHTTVEIQERTLTLELPETYAGTLKLKNSNGKLSLRDLKQLASLQMDTSFDAMDVSGVTAAGDITLKNSNGRVTMEGLAAGGALRCETSFEAVRAQRLEAAGDAAISSSNGELEVRQVKAGGDMAIQTSFGKITAEGLTAQGNLRVESSNSEIYLTNLSAGKALDCNGSFGAMRGAALSAPSMEFNNSNGAILLEDVKAPQLIRLHSSFEKISFQRLESPQIAVTNSNGDITGSILGAQKDYQIDCEVSNGEKNLPKHTEGATEKHLHIKTSFGNVEIEFAA